MPTKLCKLLCIALFSLVLAAPAACLLAHAQQLSGNAKLHNTNGMKYFNKAFYDLTPKKKKIEAAKNFDLAVQEFKKAIAIDDNSIEAHRNLARAYHFQKKHLQAARHYQKVNDINPRDLDIYVLAALSYLEIGRYGEALERLETARSYAADEKIVATLNGYIEKIQQKMAAQ